MFASAKNCRVLLNRPTPSNFFHNKIRIQVRIPSSAVRFYSRQIPAEIIAFFGTPRPKFARSLSSSDKFNAPHFPYSSKCNRSSGLGFPQNAIEKWSCKWQQQQQRSFSTSMANFRAQPPPSSPQIPPEFEGMMKGLSALSGGGAIGGAAGVFGNLSSKLSNVFATLTGKNNLSAKDVEEAMANVRVALLEADVAIPVVKKFIDGLFWERQEKGKKKKKNRKKSEKQKTHARTNSWIELLRLLRCDKGGRRSSGRRPRYSSQGCNGLRDCQEEIGGNSRAGRRFSSQTLSDKRTTAAAAAEEECRSVKFQRNPFSGAKQSLPSGHIFGRHSRFRKNDNLRQACVQAEGRREKEGHNGFAGYS